MPKPPGEGTSRAAIKRRKVSAMQTEMESLKATIAKLQLSGENENFKDEKKEDNQNKNRVLFKPSGLSK